MSGESGAEAPSPWSLGLSCLGQGLKACLSHLSVARWAVVPFLLNLFWWVIALWLLRAWLSEPTLPTAHLTALPAAPAAGWWAWAADHLHGVWQWGISWTRPLLVLGEALVCFAASVVLGILFTEPLCGILGVLDRLVLAWKTASRPEISWEPVSPRRAALRALAVLGISLSFQVPLILLSLITWVVGAFAPIIAFPLGLLILSGSALLLAWNLLDYPFSQANLNLSDRVNWVQRHWRAALALGLPLALLNFFFLPLMLPVGVVAATDLYLRTDARR